MKTTWKLITIALSALLFIQCSKEDTPKNEAPKAFTVSVNATANSATISWTVATDPEGSLVTYNVLIGGETVASKITTTTYTFTDLAYAASFSGKIVAYDDEGLTSEASYTFETAMRPNTAPTAAVLASPIVNEQSVSLMAELTWSASADAENDAITYSVYLDESADPTTKITENLSSTAYQITTQLNNNTTYYWKVIAKDTFDSETESAVGSFTTRNLVTGALVTEDTGFAARAGHTSLVFDSKMWVIGGNSCCGGRYNDVWSSTDGSNWTQVTSEANFPARTVHASVVFDSKMWVIGGNRSYNAGNEFDDIWNSTDGITWNRVTDHTDIGPRYGHKMLVYDDKMWILGGRDANNTYSSNEVWNSSDGITWTRVSPDSGIGFNLSQFTIFNNKMWRIGGYSDTKIYSSSDGISWSLEEENAPYGQRHNHSVTVWDDKIWLISGSDKATNEFQELDDVWYSKDGKTWLLAAKNAGYTATAAHTSLVYDNKIWKIAGGGGWKSFDVWNDVWTIGY